MKKATPWIIAGSVVGVGIVLYIVLHKKKSTISGSGNNSIDSPPPATPADSKPVATGRVVYSKAGLTLRTSPAVDDGFLGFGSNKAAEFKNSGVEVGKWTGGALSADQDGDINPVTGKVFMFYPVAIAGGGTYYAREDYITIK